MRWRCEAKLDKRVNGQTGALGLKWNAQVCCARCWQTNPQVLDGTNFTSMYLSGLLEIAPLIVEVEDNGPGIPLRPCEGRGPEDDEGEAGRALQALVRACHKNVYSAGDEVHDIAAKTAHGILPK